MNIAMTASRAALKLRKHSPHILFGAGIIGTIGTVVLSSRATLTAVKVHENHVAAVDRADDRLRRGVYDEEAHKHHVVQVWSATSIAYVKLYGPAFVLGVTSIALLTKSHMILTSRNSAVMAAYAAVDGAFKQYRKRVVEELGEEKDTQFAHGAVDKTVTGYDEKGNGVSKTIKVADPDARTAYGVLFDETNRHWDKDHGYNHTFLYNQEKWANILLKKQGHLFLNEVYDMLGFPRTQIGGSAGWIYDTTEGDSYVDFGFRRYPEFVNGFERSVFLDFNVDGMILDKI